MTHPHVATANHRTAPTLAVKVAAVARRAWQAYWDWRARQATIEILRALDSRTLRDIGLSRSEIESVVRERHGERRPCYDESWHGRAGA
jgi:uncharacterized protein YjiS (DUF1127 family)